MIWLGPGELAYPTLPHPFAFDRIDNDEDGCTDLEDADEIQAVVGPSSDASRRREVEGLLVRLRDLRAQLHDNAQAQFPDEIAKPSGPRDCSKKKASIAQFKLCRVDNVGKYLCGPDAVLMPVEEVVPRGQEDTRLGWKRSETAALAAPISTIQYWMYYPWDGSHLHDGEHVSVVYSGQGENAKIRALIGAGHLEGMANNVLVAEDADSGAFIKFPNAVPTHVMFVSELGKHASAADINCNGRFDLWHDSNDLASGAWGARDANYAIGKEEWKRFDPSTSFDRRTEGLLIERSAFDSDDSKKEYAKGCPTFSMGHAALQEHFRLGPSHANAYRLVMANTVQRFLAFAASAWEKGLDESAVLQSADYRTLLGLGANEPLPSQHVNLEALKAWADGPDRNTTPRPDVWNHKDFGEPKRDFRLGLFPKFGMTPLIFAAEGGNGKIGVGFRTGGWGKLRDSSLELQLLLDNFSPWWESVAEGNRKLLSESSSGIQNGHGHGFEIALHYNAFSTGLSGPYFGVSWRGSHHGYSKVYAVQNGVVSDDAGFLTLVEESGNNWNLDAGYQYRTPLKAFPLSIQLGLTGPIIRPATKSKVPNELQYYRYPDPLEVRVSIKLGFFKIIGRKHPLAARDRE